ncbi:MAG: hypothetical protein R3B68_02440 [Phycisphaerales bacterium]
MSPRPEPTWHRTAKRWILAIAIIAIAAILAPCTVQMFSGNIARLQAHQQP